MIQEDRLPGRVPQIPLSALTEHVDHRQLLQCGCCTHRRRILAAFDPPDRLIIRSKTHGTWHELVLIVAQAPVPVEAELHSHS
jgi:hypothetical protein